MGKTIIKRVPDENVYYDWRDEVDLSDIAEDIVISGDRHYILYGSSTQVDIIKGDYWDNDIDPETGEAIGYDYETIPELEKVCGGKWEDTEFRGYSQGDWCQVYYNTEKVSQEILDELEVFIMGKVDEFKVQEDEDDPDDTYYVYIPHDVVWDGKAAICKYLGYDPEETIVLEDCGYHKVYEYQEME